MKLTLDHTQRLNLHALLGAQRADVGSIRAIWSIQDRIALDADEEKAVELKREMVAGQERVVWNPALSIPAKDFEFSDPEIAPHQGGDPDVGLVWRQCRPALARTAAQHAACPSTYTSMRSRAECHERSESRLVNFAFQCPTVSRAPRNAVAVN